MLISKKKLTRFVTLIQCGRILNKKQSHWWLRCSRQVAVITSRQLPDLNFKYTCSFFECMPRFDSKLSSWLDITLRKVGSSTSEKPTSDNLYGCIKYRQLHSSRNHSRQRLNYFIRVQRVISVMDDGETIHRLPNSE